ncbi:MAG: hypothetical protein M3R25_01360 [Bacteroidota bacterium]|nr:hypothetical protein [Bacteroidota bacterium]
MRSTILVLLMGCCVILSCQLQPESLDKPEISIREDVVLQLDQSLSSSGSSLGFTFTSSLANQCQGTKYRHQSIVTPGEVSIHLISLQMPDPCIGSEANATQKIAITPHSGLYDLEIDLGDNIHNTGTLLIDDESFQIDMNTVYGLSIPHYSMVRIPSGMIWGYLYHPVKQQEAMEIVNSILDITIEEPTLDQGYYGHFMIANNGQVTVPSLNLNSASFIYKFNSTAAVLSDLATQIRAELPGGTDFRLFTWLGSEY